MSNDPIESPIAKLGIELEFSALRAELLKRIELRQQLISITLTLAGVFLGLGLNNNTIALIYPVLNSLLAMQWAQNDIRSRQIGKYLQHMENLIPGLGWETYYRKGWESETRLGPWPLSILAPGGTFLLTGLIAIGIGVTNFSFTPVEWILLTISIIAVLFTIWLLNMARRQSIRYRK